MKKVLWVLQNIKGTLSFYDELTLMMLVASVCSWRNHHHSYNELHVDSLTKNILEKLGVLHLWDNVVTEIVDSKSQINLESFWASSKVKVLKQQTEPVTIVDNDLFAYDNLLQYDELAPVIYSHDEDGLQWYFDATDEYISQLRSIPLDIIYTPNRSALNVCYLSFTDADLQSRYANWSYKVMTELSQLGAPKGAHMTYAEQKLLKQIIVHEQIDYRTLISNIYRCEGYNFGTEENGRGVWTFAESKKKYWHVGFDKKVLRNSAEKMDFLYRITSKYIPKEEMKMRVKTLLSVLS